MVTDTTIYWHDGKQYEQQIRKLAEEPITIKNKELIKQFHAHLFTTGTKYERVAKITWGLRKICRVLDKDLSKATKNDIERVVATIQTDRAYTDNTKSDYKRCLKHFFKWYEDEDPRLEKGSQNEEEAIKMYKYLRKYVKTTAPPKEIDPGSIITNQDIKKVLDEGCNNNLDRAIIALLHESGCRIGEILGMRIKDIQRKESIWSIRVNGKTGERSRPVLDSIPYLLRWLDFHPQKNEPNAFLWISENNRWRGKRINYVGACKIIKRSFERAGIKKKNNPHFFRHSRATIDAPKYKDSIQSMMMGWTQGSQQLKRYRHMAASDAEEAFMKVKGLCSQEETKEELPQNCVCGRISPHGAKYCIACGKALSLETAMKEQEYLSKAFEVLGNIMSNPELRKQFEKWKEQKNSV
jgi:integrase/recombinase XerD